MTNSGTPDQRHACVCICVKTVQLLHISKIPCRDNTQAQHYAFDFETTIAYVYYSYSNCISARTSIQNTYEWDRDKLLRHWWLWIASFPTLVFDSDTLLVRGDRFTSSTVIRTESELCLICVCFSMKKTLILFTSSGIVQLIQKLVKLEMLLLSHSSFYIYTRIFNLDVEEDHFRAKIKKHKRKTILEWQHLSNNRY